ncbi:hypothetical protein AB1Y20_007021 [Prymnesium parvum]|uniref:Uncharacterized protein n=1 Tax=Prymnesium parvum TaxID=97485 RepID=A0AB34J042_PRYPA
MSEELGSASGSPLEPPLSKKRPAPLDEPPALPSRPPAQSSPVAPVPSLPTASRNIAGGGTHLPPGDKPGDPFATLLVIAGDCLLGSQPWSRLDPPLPATVEQGLERALALLEGSRCVVICAGGPHLTQALMEAVVSRVPGGLDAFGPGRAVEALFKERAAPYGALFESALLVKALAKRQRANVRFGAVRVIAADCVADAVLRVYEHCFSDWRVLVNGGRGRGGEDRPLDIQAVRITPVVEDAVLTQRAASFDDAWFERGLADNASHPSWPGNKTAEMLARDSK